MKRQNGFTLIELLLVLAIIAIITAIAVPNFMDQRANARNTTAKANCVNLLAEFVTVTAKAREDGKPIDTAEDFKNNIIGTSIDDTAMPSLWNTKNPWPTSGAVEGYNTGVLVAEDKLNGETTANAATQANQGQVQLGFIAPSDDTAAALVAAVYLSKEQTKGKKDHVFVKVAGID
jgi:type IV pilus assembly protein PilA